MRAITAEVLRQTAEITDVEVRRDIADTQAEIEGYERRLVGLEEQAAHGADLAERKLAWFRSGAVRHEIEQRREFVDYLERLLVARQEKHG